MSKPAGYAITWQEVVRMVHFLSSFCDDSTCPHMCAGPIERHHSLFFQRRMMDSTETSYDSQWFPWEFLRCFFRHFFCTKKKSIEKSQVTQWNTSGLKLMAALPPCHPLAVSFVVFLGGCFHGLFSCRFKVVFLETPNFSKEEKSLFIAGSKLVFPAPKR